MKYQTTVAKGNDVPMFDPVFTPYKAANEVLSEYRKSLKSAGIIFRAEASDIQKTVLSDMRFRKVLINAFELAVGEVIKDTPYRRFVHLKSMCTQQKLFLKISYSSRRDQNIDNPHFQVIQEALQEKAGYVKLENGESENVIMIAIPIKKGDTT